MSEHTPLTEATREVNRVARILMAAWEKAEGKPVGVSYVATFADMARAVLAARTSTATADTGHKAGCQEYPTGWLCVSDCTTVWHDKAADTGLRERVLLEAADELPGGMSSNGARKWLRERAATAAPTTDTGARDE